MLYAALVSLLLSAASAADKPKLVVFDLAGAGGVDPSVASALTETITHELAGRSIFQVVASRDIQTLLGLERQKQVMGCSEESSSCLSELAGALGARLVMSGTVAKLGDAYQLTLQTQDSSKAIPIGRSIRISKDLASLRAQIPYAVAEATATPLPPPPSHALSYSLIGLGSAALLGGGVLGIIALTNESALNRELNTPGDKEGYLKPASAYRADIKDIEARRTLSLIGLVAGAALIGTGVLINPSDSSGGSSRVAVRFTGTGIAVAGVFP